MCCVSRWLVALPLVLVALFGAACNQSADTALPDPGVPPPEPPDIREVLAATTGAGDIKLQVQVVTHMPPDFDDGVPDRTFGGTGFLDRDKDLAGINYEMSTVPNSAGYFGQVDREMNVFYLGSEWIVSFPLMAQSLPGRLDWLSYDLETVAKPKAQKLGIGQLREIGLSDPRLAIALLGGADALEQGTLTPPPAPEVAPTPPAPGSPTFLAVADVARAAAAADPGLRRRVRGLQDLGVDSIDLLLYLDEEGRLATVTYSMSYPPKEGSEPVEMTVTHTFQKYGLEGGLNAPTGRSVSSFEEYLGI